MAVHNSTEVQKSELPKKAVVTRQTSNTGYLRDFIAVWSSRAETDKIWMSLFTPQMGEQSSEILPKEIRLQVIRDLLEPHPSLELRHFRLNVCLGRA
jgi:hypothetical protein